MAVDGEEEESGDGDGGEADEDIVAVYMGSVARQGNGGSCYVCVLSVMHGLTCVCFIYRPGTESFYAVECTLIDVFSLPPSLPPGTY